MKEPFGKRVVHYLDTVYRHCRGNNNQTFFFFILLNLKLNLASFFAITLFYKTFCWFEPVYLNLKKYIQLKLKTHPYKKPLTCK